MAPWVGRNMYGLLITQANSENCGPPLGKKFNLEVGQRSLSRSRHGTIGKDLSQRTHMPSIEALHVIVRKLWPTLKFLWQTDGWTDGRMRFNVPTLSRKRRTKIEDLLWTALHQTSLLRCSDFWFFAMFSWLYHFLSVSWTMPAIEHQTFNALSYSQQLTTVCRENFAPIFFSPYLPSELRLIELYIYIKE